MRRRKFLISASAVVSGLHAGCAAEGNQPPPDTETPTDETPDPDPTSPSPPPESDRGVQPSVRGHHIETVDTSCMSEEATGIDVSFSETAVVVDGVAQTSTPCYEARIDSASVSGGELLVTVGFDRDDGPCVECVGQLQYEATVELDTTDGISAVTVVHDRTDGNRFTEKRNDEGPAASPSDGQGSMPKASG